MRVISGLAKGRPLKAPPGLSTRPMTDRLKISLFDTLAPYGFDGTRVLDLFAGSGSLGIEMLSRGADWCDFVEANPSVCAVIRDNLRATGLGERAHVYRMFVARFLAMRSRQLAGSVAQESEGPAHLEHAVGRRERRTGEPLLDSGTEYDIILLDPPYADPEIAHTLETIARSPLVVDGSLVIIGHQNRVKLADEYGGGRAQRVRHRAMGDSAFSIYECAESDAAQPPSTTDAPDTGAAAEDTGGLEPAQG